MGKPKAWDAARDQQLFLLIIGNVKVDYNVVAQKWAEKYPDDDSKPSASAISQHINKLAKANGDTPSKAKSAGVFKPVTPSSKRVINPKTPSSSSKRQKVRNMSDDDDDDLEASSFSNIPKRESSSRRSQPARGAYVQPDSDDEDGSDILTSARSESRSFNPTLTNTAGYMSPISKRTSVNDSDDDEVTVVASRSVSKRPISKFDYFHRAAGEDSDVSDYQPLV